MHVGMGAFALLLRWLTPWQAILMAVAALVLNSFLLHDVTRGTLLRPSERASRFSRGVVLYPAILLLTFIVFRSRLELAAGVWALLAVGDGMATLSGLAFRGPRLPWNHKKTWSGLVAFVLFGTAASAWVIRWVQRAGTWTVGASFVPGGLLTLGGSDPSGRIGDAFLPGGPVDAAGAVGTVDALGAVGFPESLSFLVIGCLVATLAAALAESLDTKVDDNIRVPVVGGAVLWAATLVDPGLLIAAGAAASSGGALATPTGVTGPAGVTGSWMVPWLTGVAIAVPVTVVAYLTRAVDRGGAMAGMFLATVLYAYAAWPGLVMLGGLLVIGTAVTRVGYARKEALGVAEGRRGRKGGRRGIGSILANAGAAVTFAFLAVATPYPEAFTIAMVAAFATSLFDTTATEVGQAFGRRAVLVTTWRAVPEGTPGGVSLVGTLAGVMAATLLAGAGWAMGLIAGLGALAVIFGAFCGSTLESFLGAMMGKGGRSDHHLRNLANTVVGAGVAWGLVAWLLYPGGPIELP
ncbi:MAG: DUF92 domain-containing protein [Gemmatimonadetes bacterium]|nr:DUF92 domain-containing protein [Gemmatimonadota bacterium]